MHRFLFLIGLLAAPDAIAKPHLTATQAVSTVLDVLENQVKAWNRGDLEAFCAVYADDTLFISPKGLTRGRAAVLARYKKRYPDKAAMGALHIEIVETRPGKNPGRLLSVAGRWTLKYPDKPPISGHTLIVWQRQGKVWRIVQDASM